MQTDVVVVGLGAMGAAALYQLARRGVRAVGVDRYDPPHTLGSSHGETRITRCAVGEGEELVPLVLRTHEIWRELEAETGEALLDACGFLMMAPRGIRAGHHSKRDYLRSTVNAAERHGLAHEMLDNIALARRFPTFKVTEEEGYFEPGGGLCLPGTLHQGAAKPRQGAWRVGQDRDQVTRIEPAAHGVRVDLDGETIVADRVVVATGAWAADLLGAAFKPCSCHGGNCCTGSR